MIYLDNNATTRIAPEVRSALLPWLDEEYGNPSSQNGPGQRAREAVQRARQQLAAVLGAMPAELVFTGSATESNHTAILSALRQYGGQRRHLVSTVVEHPSSLKLFEQLKQEGYRVTLLGVNQHGELDLDAAAQAIDDDTALVSAMWANNETGVVFPVEQLARLAHARGALFHTDAVQAIGRLPLEWRNSQIDLLTFSGHKVHAGKGIGALLVRKGLALAPLLHGSQERNRRGGTENVAAIVALGQAAMLFDPDSAAHMASLRDQLEQQVCASLPFARINGSSAPRVANTSNICFGSLTGEALLTRLERAGVIAGSGAACQSGGSAPSHVLTAMGLNRAAARASLRFSLSRYTTAAEIRQATELICRIALELELQHLTDPIF